MVSTVLADPVVRLDERMSLPLGQGNDLTADHLHALVKGVAPLDEAAMASARARQTQLLKPPGSLGRLEHLSIHLAGILAQDRPRLVGATVVIMAADHGVTAEGVSAYPASVTAHMVGAVLAGQAA